MTQFLVTFRDGIQTPPTPEAVMRVLTQQSAARYMERAVTKVEVFERQEPANKVTVTPWKLKRGNSTIAQFASVEAAAEYINATDLDLLSLSIVFDLVTI